MHKDQRVVMAEIVGVWGVRGHIKIKTFTQNPTDICAYGALQTDKDSQILLKEIVEKGVNLITAKIDGVSDRNEAALWVGQKLYVDRAHLPDISKDDSYYHIDLVGSTLQDHAGHVYGTVMGVQNAGAGDFLDVVTTDKKAATLPFSKESVLDIDVALKKIIIDPAFLLL